MITTLGLFFLAQISGFAVVFIAIVTYFTIKDKKKNK